MNKKRKTPRLSPSNNLAVNYPDLAEQWHPSKNADLGPDQVTPHANKRVWWKCEKGHEWQVSPNVRISGTGCPFCSNRAVGADNNLRVVIPRLATEWHVTKNGDLQPDEVTPGSHLKVWWKCTRGHEWAAVIYTRSKGVGCPYCSGRLATPENNFAAKHPNLVKEWHPTLNSGRSPATVTPWSQYVAWWKCRHNHEWKARVSDRSKGSGCPYCSGAKVIPGDSFADRFPELAAQWHPDKNGSVKPSDLSYGSSGRPYWWICEYGHEWRVTINSRTGGRTGCPKCNPKTSLPEIRLFCELKEIFGDVLWHKRFKPFFCDIYIPDYRVAVEYDGTFWHDGRRQKDISRDSFLTKKGIRIFRVRAPGLDPITIVDVISEDHEMTLKTVKALLIRISEALVVNHEHQQTISSYLRRKNFANETEFRDIVASLPYPPIETSFAKQCPALVKEWDVAKNLPFKPSMFTAHSGRSVWWKCRLGHEWQARIADRSSGSGCPDCAGKRPSQWNNLMIKFPEVALEWHDSKNGGLTPYDVAPATHTKVWWKCRRGHEWQTTVASRTQRKASCPYCSGRRVDESNNLAVLHPEVAKLWHLQKNGSLKPEQVRPRSNRKVWWRCNCGHEWMALVYSLTRGSRCPRCARKGMTSR